MNPILPPFDDDAREREWQAQERALQAERHGLDPAGDDVRQQRYRLLARALRQPPDAALPADFAARVAARLETAATAPAPVGRRPESVLLTALVGAFAVAAAVVLVRYGPAWLPAFRTLSPAGDPQALRWLLALAGCLGLSWLLGQGPRRLPH
ncbi:hypothetical protein QMK61_01940 [Fulvimonas sp. R45]|uniref:hypothetical protein n=1 Tax=Fulvimonas sp. R45 TaxID=3045937 RepID=UPI00265F6382|nr:hypothetical protein [Fulvimonas sp. R45]MDO1527580.1 hypothetical protein [Fulvimonas sp. R45]